MIKNETSRWDDHESINLSRGSQRAGHPSYQRLQRGEGSTSSPSLEVFIHSLKNSCFFSLLVFRGNL